VVLAVVPAVLAVLVYMLAMCVPVSAGLRLRCLPCASACLVLARFSDSICTLPHVLWYNDC
jgi:hypothetical protein